MAEHNNGTAEHRVFESSSGSADGTKATSEKSPSELAWLVVVVFIVVVNTIIVVVSFAVIEF